MDMTLDGATVLLIGVGDERDLPMQRRGLLAHGSVIRYEDLERHTIAQEATADVI